MNEELKKKIIDKDKEYNYEDIEEDFGGATGTAPSPNLGRPSVNGINTASGKSYKGKSLKDATKELQDLLDKISK